MSFIDATVTMNSSVLSHARWKLYWWVFGRWLLTIAALCLALGLLAAALGLSSSVFWTLIILGPLIAAEALVFALLRLRAKPTALTDGVFHFVADSDGLRVDGAFGTQTFKWTTYKKAFLDSRFLYLMVSSRTAQVIPLSAKLDLQPLLEHLESVGVRPRRFTLLQL